MNIIFNIKRLAVLIFSCTLSLSAFANFNNYKVISSDYIVSSEQIKIEFNPSIVKESATISFQACLGCPWSEAQTYEGTDYFHKYEQISYKKFKQKVKSFQYNPPKGGYKALISIDNRNNNILNIKWNYVEL